MATVNRLDPAQSELQPPSEQAREQLLIVEGVARSFGETKALVAADLAVATGEIHALIGENGSGKSTLIKILSGVIPPASGNLLWSGRAAKFSNPRDVQADGIATVFQETLVVPELSVRDNVYIGTDGLFRYGRRKRDEVTGASAAIRALGIDQLDLDRPAWTLSLAERQLVTIARAIVRPWRLLILDEGTSALDASQRDRVFDYLRSKRTEGKSVLFTSHRMDEVFDLADRITVLRMGRTVSSYPVGDASQHQVLVDMSGRESVEDLEAAAEHASDAGAGEGGLAHGAVLRVEDLVLRHGASPISLELRRGEILGVAGLEGQGQVEFVECLCALRRATSGRVLSIDNEGHGAAIHSYADANRHGIRYVPRDRRHEGMFAPLSVFDNFAMALWSKLNVFGVLKRNEAKRRYREYSDASHLVAGSKGRSVSTLSGGNQQKILLGRWVAMNPRTLVLNDPLRGVDVRTREDLYQYFRSLASNGIAIVFLSTEIIELLRLTERIAVFHEGHLHALLESKKATDTNVVAAMFGRDPEHHADA